MKENCLFPLVTFHVGTYYYQNPDIHDRNRRYAVDRISGRKTRRLDLGRSNDGTTPPTRTAAGWNGSTSFSSRANACRPQPRSIPISPGRRCVGASRRTGAPHRRNGCAPSSAMRPSSPSDSSPQVRCCFPTGLRTTAPVRSRPKSGPARSVSPTVRTYD